MKFASRNLMVAILAGLFSMPALAAAQPKTKTQTKNRAKKRDYAELIQQVRQEKAKAKKFVPKKFVSMAGGFSVLMLNSPKETVINMKPQPDKKVKLHLFQSADGDGNMVAIAGYHDLEEEPATEKKIKEVLQGAVAGAVESASATATKYEEAVLDRNPGRHVEYRTKRLGKDIRGITRIFIRGKRVYQINYLAAGDSFDPVLGKKIVQSLKFTPIDDSETDGDDESKSKKPPAKKTADK